MRLLSGSGLLMALGAAIAVPASHARAQEQGIQAYPAEGLPEPEARPLAIDFTDDPVLALADATADAEAFRTIVVAALEESPTGREARALEEVADARLSEARSAYMPTIDLGVTGFTTLERNFTDDPSNFLERSRPRERVDFNLNYAHTLWDFGAIDASVRSATARLRAAGYDREARTSEVAGDVTSAWTQVFAFQSLERLLEGYLAAQDGLAAAVEKRIERGVSAEGDRARVASLKAQAMVQLAQITRRRASAEARFRQLSGTQAPEGLLRPPILDATQISQEYAALAAETAPQVKSAEAVADARDADADAAEAQRLPLLSARIDSARYGFTEPNRNDLDTRATLDLTWRIFGGGVWERARAAGAEADAADAVADRIREEAIRDAEIAWSDVHALETQLAALEDAYKASRQSRDIVVARFGALRGSLFDVADAQNVYLDAASAYIQALTELDQARYILLLRTGRLLDTLGLEQGAAK